MSTEIVKELHKSCALELANIGIGFSVTGDYPAARDAWQKALTYVEVHLPGDDICFWIRDGLGATLLQTGDYHGAIAMAGSALEWCSLHRAPQASLTMAKCFLRLGNATRAREYARQACALRDDTLLIAFSPEDRDALGHL